VLLKYPKGHANAHLLCCAASLVIAAYVKIRLIPQDLRALHLNVFEQPQNIMEFQLKALSVIWSQYHDEFTRHEAVGVEQRVNLPL
jgi:hypothetical protein